MGVAEAIRCMVVRGAPAIGITAAYGLAIAQVSESEDMEEAAAKIHSDDVHLCRRLGQAGAGLLKGGVMTICNTGALATGGHGTALGMVRSALEQGTALRLYVNFKSTTSISYFQAL